MPSTVKFYTVELNNQVGKDKLSAKIGSPVTRSSYQFISKINDYI